MKVRSGPILRKRGALVGAALGVVLVLTTAGAAGAVPANSNGAKQVCESESEFAVFYDTISAGSYGCAGYPPAAYSVKGRAVCEHAYHGTFNARPGGYTCEGF